MRNLIVRFLREEDGMEFVEWALVAALFAVVGAAGWRSLADLITTELGEVESCLDGSTC